MTSILHRLAGSRLASYLGALATVLGVLCISNRDDIVTLAPLWGPRACALVALIGAGVSLFGKSVIERRSETPVEQPKAEGLLDMGAIPERRRHT